MLGPHSSVRPTLATACEKKVVRIVSIVLEVGWTNGRGCLAGPIHANSTATIYQDPAIDLL